MSQTPTNPQDSKPAKKEITPGVEHEFHKAVKADIRSMINFAPDVMDLYRSLKNQGMDIRDAFEMTKVLVEDSLRHHGQKLSERRG